MSKRKKVPLEVKINITLGVIGSILSVLALVVSGWSAIKTNYTSQQLVEYQLEQERLPRVAGLNYRLPIDIKYLNTYRGNKIVFSSLSQNLYPIKIPIYNVGVGIAQNCEIEWDQQSIDDACVQLIDLLKYSCDIHEFEYSKIIEESGELWAYQDYIFPIVDGNHQSVWFDAYYASDNRYVGYDYKNFREDLMCKDIQIPYLIPILNQAEPSYISFSKGLSILLLEAATYKIETPISLGLNIGYQDLTGSNYSEILTITFSLNVPQNSEETAEFQISFETISES